MKHHISTSRGSTLTTAAHACRVPIFAPTRRPQGVMQQRVETAWGEAHVTGRIGQQHHDVLDVIAVVAGGWRAEGTHGDRAALIDSAKFRSILGWDKWTYTRIRNVLRDLRAAEVELLIHGAKTEWTGILTHIVESGEPPPERVGARQRWRGHAPMPEEGRTPPRDGMMWEVVVSGAWIELVRRLCVRYPLLITQMRYGVSQAVARLMLSHRIGARLRIDTALGAVGVQSRRRARARREILIDTARMAGAGVQVDWAAGLILHDRPDPLHDRPDPERGARRLNYDRPDPENDRPSPGDDRPSPGDDRPDPENDRTL